MVNTILKEADLFCPNSVRINFTIYHNCYTKSEKKRNDRFEIVSKPYPSPNQRTIRWSSNRLQAFQDP
ncbi:hypothetical protein FJ911_15390 [Lactiplantibacillus plantarum]|nr:hypothetical protein D7Y66_16570 [Lactiplantibacillus plantarum]RZN66559.1 hypothetical protein EHJ90_16570 [Lactiplantibacillus plantarum]TPV62565.1 hypothetical protein FJ911_15390 [Lactiplantibacillus plantarum]